MRKLQETAKVWHTDTCPIVLNNTLFYAEAHLAVFEDAGSIDDCCEQCNKYPNCTAFTLGQANAAIPGLAGKCFLKAIADDECPLDLGQAQPGVVSGMPYDNGCYATSTTPTTTLIQLVPAEVVSAQHQEIDWSFLWWLLLLLVLLLSGLAIWFYYPRKKHHKYRGLNYPMVAPIATVFMPPPVQQPPPQVQVSRAQQVNTYTEGFVDGMAAAIATGHANKGRKTSAAAPGAAWPPPE